jgi:hypothetical protein
MKKFALLFVSVFSILAQHSNAQVKILFDAAHAQQAGNADWIIDGDGGVAAHIPTPAQSGITGSTAETYWTGALSNWGIDCVKQGYTVETLTATDSITYGNSSHTSDLTHYLIFIVDEPNTRFTTAERKALVNFVYNGGRLLMISDHNQSDRNNDGWDSPAIWNDLFTNNGIVNNPFGISFDLQNFSETSSNIGAPNDSIVKGSFGTVTQIMWSNGTSITVNNTANSTAKGIIYKTGSSFGTTNIMVAKAYYGQGKVFAMGDSSPADDGTGTSGNTLYNGYTGDVSGNHQRLLMNATIWLAANTVTATNDVVLNKENIKLYPNPTTDQINVQFNLNHTSVVTFKLTDISGRTILTQKNTYRAGNNNVSIHCSGLQKGVYLLQTIISNKATTQKIVIE